MMILKVIFFVFFNEDEDDIIHEDVQINPCAFVYAKHDFFSIGAYFCML